MTVFTPCQLPLAISGLLAGLLIWWLANLLGRRWTPFAVQEDGSTTIRSRRLDWAALIFGVGLCGALLVIALALYQHARDTLAFRKAESLPLETTPPVPPPVPGPALGSPLPPGMPGLFRHQTTFDSTSPETGPGSLTVHGQDLPPLPPGPLRVEVTSQGAQVYNSTRRRFVTPGTIVDEQRPTGGVVTFHQPQPKTKNGTMVLLALFLITTLMGLVRLAQTGDRRWAVFLVGGYIIGLIGAIILFL